MQDEERVKMIMEFAMRLVVETAVDPVIAVERATAIVLSAEKICRLGIAYGMGASQYVQECGPEAAERFARELEKAAQEARQVDPRHPSGGPNGLHSKFRVFRADGTPERRSSFVLVPFDASGEVRDPAAVAALREYARTITNEPQPGQPAELGHQIFDWMQNPFYVTGLNAPGEEEKT